MQIISNFDDYYDPMLQYGMDKSLTFTRINKNNFKNNKIQDWQMDVVESEKIADSWDKKIQNINLNDLCGGISDQDDSILSAYNHSIVKIRNVYPAFEIKPVAAIINGKAFVSYMLLEFCNLRTPDMVAYSTSYKIIKKNASMKELFDHIKANPDYFDFRFNSGKNILAASSYEEFSKNKKQKYLSYRWNRANSDNPVKEEDFLSIHEELQTPVFFLYKNKVYKDLPLSYFGLVNVFDGNMEKTYQEIAYCIGNVVMNKNEPPVDISDLDKVQQHGFDKKVSFRHRK